MESLIVFACLCILFGLLLLNGQGLSLINIPEAKRAKYDERALGRFIGISMFGYAAGFGGILAGAYYKNSWFEISGFTLMLLLSAFLVVSVLKGNRFINKKE